MALLYGRHHVRVYRFALRITGDASSAEDVVSEVFLQVWRQADKFESRAQVSTWLLAIARNKSLSEVQRRSANHLDWETIEIADPADDAEISSQKRDRSELIRRCLSQLSAVQREVIDLVYYHEKSVADVARIVGVPAEHREDAHVPRAPANRRAPKLPGMLASNFDVMTSSSVRNRATLICSCSCLPPA